MYNNYSNNGIDSFPFNTGSFHPSSAQDAEIIGSGEKHNGMLTISSCNGILSWVKHVLNRA